MIKLLLLILLIFHTKEEITINLGTVETGSGQGYTVGENKIEITNEGTYSITGNSNRAIVISSSITLKIEGTVQISQTGQLPPIEISSGCQVTFHLVGSFSLIDNESNEKHSVIYMNSGSTLTITSDTPESSSLYLNTLQWGIYGKESTNLNINNGVGMQHNNGNSDAIFIELGGNIAINYATIVDNNIPQSINYPSFKAGGSITFNKGSLKSKTIQAEDKIIFRFEENQNNDYDVIIQTKDEGMKAKDIEIYSSKITIISEKDSLSATGNIKIDDSFVNINAGSSELTSSPFKKSGILQITDSMVIAYGTNCEGGITSNQGSFSYVGEIKPSNNMAVTMQGNTVFNLAPDKEYSYFYFTIKGLPIEANDKLQMTVNGQIVQSDDNSCSVNSNSNSNDRGKKKNSAKNNLKMIRLYYVLLISLLLF